MSLEEFLNLEGEDLVVEEQELQEVNVEDLIQQHPRQGIEGEEAAIEDEQVIEIVVPSGSEALRAVELV